MLCSMLALACGQLHSHTQLLMSSHGVYSYVSSLRKIVTVRYNAEPINGFIVVQDPVRGVAIDVPNIELNKLHGDTLAEVTFSRK